MWIKREEYENLVEDVMRLNARSTEQLKIIDKFFDERKDRAIEISVLRRQIEELEVYKQEAEEYKQKYADEVNKRLELIKFYEEKPNKETVS